ncbi:MAG: Hsp20/alpha crystallin family protein [Nitrosomonadales bacterium]|nr:Hsp20/alpha crystallin family protein [Nitrosomonadales bacterium]
MNNLTRLTTFGNPARFDPFRNDDWFKGFWVSPLAGEAGGAPQIKINLTENDKSYSVRAELPGVKKEDIKVNVDGNRVSISAEIKQEKEEKRGDKTICRECYQGTVCRSFSLESKVDEPKAQAKFDNGVLELTLPKKNGNGARQIQIK